MRIVADEVKLKKDLEAFQVVEKLESFLDRDDEYVYYKYPIYRGDIAEDLIQAHILVTSPRYGVIYISCRFGDTLSEKDIKYLENLDSHIFKKFISRPELRKTRRDLKFDLLGLVTSTSTRLENEVQYVKISDIEECIEAIVLDEPLNDEEYSILVSCIDNTAKMSVKKQRPVIASSNKSSYTKSQILDIIQRKEPCFDFEQRKVAMVSIDGPQRIRGLAGSGKTILLTMKAALYHLANPDAEILYTYYTKDLYGLVRNLIDRFYRESADNHEPNWKKIHIYHAWGGVELEGVYSSTCISLGEYPIPFKTAYINRPSSPFGYVCSTLLGRKIPQKYDLTLIDEGQDFPNEFYRLCYKLTKQRRIVWAYDDFQNIYDVKLQDEKETFGKNEEGQYLVDFSRNENNNQDIVLHCCYRTPRKVLITAFALGMGIYNSRVLQRLESNMHWNALGFEVEAGECHDGDGMIISRPLSNTPSNYNEQFNKYSISLNKFASIEDECKYVSKSIYNDISNEGLLPDDICVICLDDRCISTYYITLSNELRSLGVGCFNMLNAPNANKRFSFDGMVTLATLNKAKGNEAGMVYIVGIDRLFRNPDNIKNRNRLFTAITRAKGWVCITGVGEEPMNLLRNELNDLINNDFKLIFTQPSEEQTHTAMRGSLSQQEKIGALQMQVEALKSSGMDEDSIIKLIKGE